MQNIVKVKLLPETKTTTGSNELIHCIKLKRQNSNSFSSETKRIKASSNEQKFSNVVKNKLSQPFIIKVNQMTPINKGNDKMSPIISNNNNNQMPIPKLVIKKGERIEKLSSKPREIRQVQNGDRIDNLQGNSSLSTLSTHSQQSINNVNVQKDSQTFSDKIRSMYKLQYQMIASVEDIYKEEEKEIRELMDNLQGMEKEMTRYYENCLESLKNDENRKPLEKLMPELKVLFGMTKC